MVEAQQMMALGVLQEHAIDTCAALTISNEAIRIPASADTTKLLILRFTLCTVSWLQIE
jgi:hypothetical protein